MPYISTIEGASRHLEQQLMIEWFREELDGYRGLSLSAILTSSGNEFACIFFMTWVSIRMGPKTLNVADLPVQVLFLAHCASPTVLS
jgi:hypothetical protein